jgi:hypothetical protein
MEHPRRLAPTRRAALLVALGLAEALGGITVASTAPTDPHVAAIRAVDERWRAVG